MSLAILLMTFLLALVLSNLVDGVPTLLIGWAHFPNWLLWGSLLALVAWCMDSAPPNQ